MMISLLQDKSSEVNTVKKLMFIESGWWVPSPLLCIFYIFYVNKE